MPKALLVTALLATAMASASAYSDGSNQPPPLAPKAAMADKSPRMKMQADTETVKVRAVYSPNIRPNPQPAFAPDDGDADASGWRSYGMLLATLVLMGVIAVRRYKAGRP